MINVYNLLRATHQGWRGFLNKSIEILKTGNQRMYLGWKFKGSSKHGKKGSETCFQKEQQGKELNGC